MKKDENQHFNQFSHEITHKINKKNKIYYRPTDPNFFGNVSGNLTLIFYGLMGSPVCLSVCLSFRLSVRNSVLLTNKLQYLKFG